MHKKFNKFLIVSFIGVIILGVYSYFYNDLKSEASSNGSLVSSLDSTTNAAPTLDNSNASLDTAFLTKLASLTSIKIDTSLFTSKTFNSLVDNNIKLDPVPYGRTNPFSPSDKIASTTGVTVSPIKANPALSITDKSVIFSGSLNGGVVSNNIYFEYGISPNFGKLTPKLSPSLTGNFSSSVTGLISKTTYYFRAVANINGVLTYSETMSFDTT